MQCPTCGTTNPAQARFCMGCGVLLVGGVVCGACQTLLPAQARYCYYCGTFLAQAGRARVQPGEAVVPEPPVAMPQPLPATSTPPLGSDASPSTETLTPGTVPALDQLPSVQPLEELLPSLKHYLPEGLYEPLERRPKVEHFEQVRDHLAALLKTTKTYLPRPVVMAPQPAGEPAGDMCRGVFLFGDVSGFTPLSEQLKPLGQVGAERITEIINALFSQLVDVLFAHDGTLLKFGGDALLGLFPVETDDDLVESALKAAQASLAMQHVLARDEFAAIEAAGETRTLKIKCGISAGPYFAAHIGTRPSATALRGTMAYVTTGRTVNLAEEAEGHAHPGEVCLTRDVAELLGDRIEFGPVSKEPDEDYCLLLDAPPAAADALAQPLPQEPPEGETQAQITYLVGRLNRLTPYLSDELVSRIVTNPQDARITPEHRPVTVMFANYKGISRLIEKMGHSRPDLITRHLHDYFVHMAEIVERFEGTVARMDQYSVGDRLVIFFGAPRAHEDDPVRAVYTALAMQQAVRKNFAALRTATGVYRFEQRIGINSGELFAGNAGASDLRQEYTLMGDDINMAARLMSNAGWSQILVSASTQKHVAAYFDLEDKGKLKVKGKEIRIPTFEVLGKRGEVGRTRGLGEDESPLTGRDEQLDILKKHSQVFLQGRGQILSIVGNSGLGKSRLLRELKAWLFAQEESSNIQWIEARALSFSEQMSYWLAAEMMRGLLDLEADADGDDVLFALGQVGEQLMGDEAMEAVPYLAHMMGLDLGEEWAWVRDEDPRVRQKQTFWAASEYFTWAAKERPIILALDDLHWADEASLALVEHMLTVTDRSQLMFCLLFRPMRDKHCWQLRDRAASEYPHRYTEVSLLPLSRELSAELLAKLLPGAEFAPETLDDILDKAAGNPFYLEEVVRALMLDEAVVPDAEQEGQWRTTDKIAQIAVPDTLHAAIIARIDRLTEDARQALQMAAVIGRQFRLEILRQLAQAEAEIDLWTAQLERGGLIRPMEVAVDPTYAFPDALVQEVAYDTLLVQSRQQLHRRVGETLEEIFAEKPEAGCELMAYHYSRGDNQEQAIKYLEMAARKARGNYANETAIEYYHQVREIKRSMGDKAGQASALYSMGVMAYEIGDYARARVWLTESISLLHDLADAQNEAWSVMYLGMVDLKQANFTQAAQLHGYALKLARAREDRFQEGIHLTNLARVTMRLGQYELALEQFQQSLEMKRQANDLAGQGFAHFYQGLIYLYQARLEEADAALQEAKKAWAQVDKNDRVMSYYHRGAGRLALAQGQQHGAGGLALARGHFEHADEHLRFAHDISVRLVLKAEIIENLSAWSQAKLGLGELDEATQLSDEAINLLAAQKDVDEVQQIYLNHYRLLAARDDPAAHEFLQRAYDTMIDQAERISDEVMRQTFLEKVKVNQEISAYVVKT